MNTRPPYPKKKKPGDIHRTPLKELPLSEEDSKDLAKGVELFNAGKFWHAHEAWESVWRRHVEDERLFLQGLIQLAAAYHHAATKRSFRGVINNLNKAYEKLEVFQPEYSGVAVIPLLRAIENGKKEAERVGEGNLQNFDCLLIPKIQFARHREPRSQEEIPGG